MSSSDADFVHLHLHTQYSLLDGAIRIEDLMKKAVDYNMPAVAVTDHGSMFGIVQFYKEAKKYHIKPIIGCEVYVAPGDMLDKDSTSGIADVAYHLTLLVKDNIGYKNLIKMVSLSYIDGFYYRPRIDKKLLQEHSEGLIALSGCMKGEVAYMIRQGDMAKAEEAASFYAKTMGEGNFYLELQENGIPEQAEINRGLKEISKKLSLPLVATNDCHYLNREDAKAHDALLCIQTGKKISDEKRMKMSTDEFYFKSPEEMKSLFRDNPEAIANTIDIANRCNFEFDFNTIHLPKYEPPSDTTLSDYLRDRVRHGLEERLRAMGADEKTRDLYYARKKAELEVINKMGYAAYFLIVWDIIDYARRNGIPVGPGRGSAAGSLVAYALKITNIDPIRYGLIFERFLNPDRVSMPDIDIDFCKEGREEMITYVAEKYKNVSQIITFGSMNARAVIRDVGRVMDMPYGDVDKIAKMIPEKIGITLEEAIAENKELDQLISSDKQVAELFKIAKTLEGLGRHASTHAAGVVISPKPITEYLPLYKNTRSGDITTQLQMSDVEELGMLKMDFLGLRTLTVIRKTEDEIRKKVPGFSVEDVPVDDEPTYKLLGEGKTSGVFQLESAGLKDIIRSLKPGVFEDIIALVALYRPGPLGSGMVTDFIARKHGRVPTNNIIPALDPILNETYGVILYQEQVMKIASVVGGFSLGEADLLRRAMGKKKPEAMAKLREKFTSGAKKKGINEAKARKIFDNMEYFGGYGFNKSHSAAYGLVSYWTAYLKAHYPTEYMASVLSSEMGDTDKIMTYIFECREMGIAVLPPDINECGVDFLVKGKDIRFGLAAVKNVGEGAVKAIMEAREKSGRFDSFFSFFKNVDLRVVNRRVVESLIKCGAFDSIDSNRARLFNSIDASLEAGQRMQRDKKSGQASLFGGSVEEDIVNMKVESETPWTEMELLHNEKEALGFYITGHPLNGFKRDIEIFTSDDTNSIVEKKESPDISIAGIVVAKRIFTTKRGEHMATVTIEDLKGLIEVIIFPKLYAKLSNMIYDNKIIWVKGALKFDKGKHSINAEDIHPLDQLRGYLSSTLHVEINPLTAAETVEELKLVLSKYKGNSSILIHLRFIEGEGYKIAVDDSIKVDPTDEMIDEVGKIVGVDSVYLS
ncbi:MAG: DNA polymerase III subunit alpha [Nitrospinota bacterium]|nr:DNA polymerase III subunit alpha [Nitrospinota bacterium]